MRDKITKTVLGIGCIFPILFGTSACTDTTIADLGSFGDKQVVCMLDDEGKVIRKWRSTGKVNSHNGGLHLFNDEKTGLYVKISGRAIISTHDYCPEIDY